MTNKNSVLSQGNSNITVYLPNSELKTIRTEVESLGRQSVETGGVLLGRYLPGDKVVVYEATKPGQNADHHQAEFAPDVDHGQDRLDRLRQEWDVHWIGTWHKHPGDLNTPSSGDIAQMRDFVDDQDTLDRITAIIATVEPSGRIRVNSFHMGSKKRVAKTGIENVDKSDPMVQSLAFGDESDRQSSRTETPAQTTRDTNLDQGRPSAGAEIKDDGPESVEPSERANRSEEPTRGGDQFRTESYVKNILSKISSPFTQSGSYSDGRKTGSTIDIPVSEPGHSDRPDKSEDSDKPSAESDDSTRSNMSRQREGGEVPKEMSAPEGRDRPRETSHSDAPTGRSVETDTGRDAEIKGSAETIVEESYVDLQRHQSVSNLDVRRGDDILFVELSVHTGPPVVLALPSDFPDSDVTAAYRDDGLKQFKADTMFSWDESTTLVDVFEDVLQKSDKHTLIDLG